MPLKAALNPRVGAGGLMPYDHYSYRHLYRLRSFGLRRYLHGLQHEEPH